MELKLDGVWRLKRWDPDAPMDEVFSPAFLPEGWLEVPVPGDVRTALSARGLIDGYYLGKALDQERWIDRSDWLYYLRFTPPSDKKGLPFLCFLGVDTLAEVWLNGQQLGACDNMFTPWCFPVSDVLKPGDNILVVRIRSTVHALAGRDRTGLYPEDDTDRLMLRKSQMNFGWDFCGHCLTHGALEKRLASLGGGCAAGRALSAHGISGGRRSRAGLGRRAQVLHSPLNTQGLTVRLRIWQDADPLPGRDVAHGKPPDGTPFAFPSHACGGLDPMGNLSCTMRKLRCCATSKSSISINSAWVCASLSCYSRPCHRGDAGSPSV